MTKRRIKKPRVWNLRAAVFSALRRVSRKTPAYGEALRRVKREYFVPSKHGKSLRRVAFECEQCAERVLKGQYAVDHIAPVIDIKTGFVNYDTYIERLFVSADGLQVLCKPCHSSKTKAENKGRREKIAS